MACILLLSSALRVHDSQAHRKISVTRERISRILELREILSFQTGLNLVNAAVVCAILESIWLGTLISYNRAQVLQVCVSQASVHFPAVGSCGRRN